MAGARLRNGPPPDPNALRREREPDWAKLSAEPVTDPAPDWPLEGQTPREAVLWATMWRLPQSRIWRKNTQALEVAMHVRTFADAETTGASTAQRTLVRQQMESLLLTLPAMRAARIAIVDTAPAAVPSAPRASNRDRLKVLSGGDTA